MSAPDFNALVAKVARAKRRVDRVGGLLVESERRYEATVAELDRAIRAACAPPAPAQAEPDVERVIPMPRAAIAPQSAPTVDDRRSLRCGLCRRAGHNSRTCPEMQGPRLAHPAR